MSFEHTKYQEEVEQRWGKQAFADGDNWWRSMTDAERTHWKKLQDDLISDWKTAAESGANPSGEAAQALANRQEQWLGSIPGTPGFGTGEVPAAYLLGLAEMYVADERFAANYGGFEGAKFVRDALFAFVSNRNG